MSPVATRRGGRLRRRGRPADSSVPLPRGARSDDGADVSLTPMIDVMMSLLIIFLVVTPVLTAYETHVPQAQNPQPAAIDDAVRVGIGPTGTLFIGDEPVPDAEFPARLAAVYEARPGDHLMYLWADRDAPFHDVLATMEVARHAGVRRVGAIVEPVDRGRDAPALTSASAGAEPSPVRAGISLPLP